MAIRGKTTFELTDVNTGKVEKYEDHNMVTNGLANFLDMYGEFAKETLLHDSVRNGAGWNTLLGGIMLFDQALDENADNTFVPAGVNMVGNGSFNTSNSGDVTELGSYNATESGLQSDGSVKLVYDFSTAQANGTIHCACLTSNVGGYIGVGNGSGNRIGTTDVCTLQLFYPILNNISYGSGSRYYHNWMYAVYDENAIYSIDPRNLVYSSTDAAKHWRTTGKIDILKLSVSLKSYDLRHSPKLDYSRVKDTYSVSIPQSILSYMGTSNSYVHAFSDPIERSVYITFNKSSNLPSGNYMWVMKIDRNMNVTSYQVYNNTGRSLSVSSLQCVFTGDYMWVTDSGNTGYLYGIKYADSTQVIDAGNVGQSNLHLFGENLIGIYNYKSNNQHNIYDAVSNVLKPINGQHSTSYETLIPFADKKGIYLAYNYNTKPNDLSLFKDIRYLATINNLQEPVVKTASKTMKVTYTLTFEE